MRKHLFLFVALLIVYSAFYVSAATPDACGNTSNLDNSISSCNQSIGIGHYVGDAWKDYGEAQLAGRYPIRLPIQYIANYCWSDVPSTCRNAPLNGDFKEFGSATTNLWVDIWYSKSDALFVDYNYGKHIAPNPGLLFVVIPNYYYHKDASLQGLYQAQAAACLKVFESVRLPHDNGELIRNGFGRVQWYYTQKTRTPLGAPAIDMHADQTDFTSPSWFEKITHLSCKPDPGHTCAWEIGRKQDYYERYYLNHQNENNFVCVAPAN